MKDQRLVGPQTGDPRNSASLWQVKMFTDNIGDTIDVSKIQKKPLYRRPLFYCHQMYTQITLVQTQRWKRHIKPEAVSGDMLQRALSLGTCGESVSHIWEKPTP